MRSGDLLVETQSNIQSTFYLSAKTFLDSPLLVTPNKSLNYCRGVISEPDLLCTSDAEILEGFSDQGVVQIRRLLLKKDADIIPTKHIILTFNSPKLPTTIKAGYLNSDLLTSTSPIAVISESEPVNPVPNNVPSTSNISAFPSNSGVQPTSASTSIQDTKLKAKTRARKRKKRAPQENK
ncbi:uncharacterized protein TNCV_4323171 [Trichonephila clavipes]|nr:uncharacterized protein TNCV_4323171 [Trichonephila clavipes]